MIEQKRFGGIMNLDDKPEFVLPNQHIDALNLRFYGGSQGLTSENIVGNTLISNSLPSGNNECIGSFYDALKQRLFWLNYNSSSFNGIYYLDVKTGIISKLLLCFTDSQTDILGFDLDYPSSGMDIIYTTEGDGDILTWNTRNKPPRQLNILQAQNSLYGSNWLEEYINVIKQPPSIPAKVAYENDVTVTVNNLRKKLFKLKYRYWYTDNQKSTWSSESEIAVPFNYTDPQADTDPTKNCRIGCIIQTGDPSVVKVEVAAAESLGNVFSNYFSVVILNKSDLSIADNDTYLWRFYNNEAYDYVDLQESLLDFDRVPDFANTQALLNGNVIVYGGITEGKDPVVPNVLLAPTTEYPLRIDCYNVMSVTQYGKEGFQAGENIHFIVIGTIRRGQTFTAEVDDGVTTYTITYTAVVGDTTTEVLAGLSANATGQGFTEVSIDNNELVISLANQELLYSNITTTDQSISGNFQITSANSTVKIIGGASFLSLFSKGVMFYIYGNTLNVNPFITVSSSVNGADLDVVVEVVLANENIATSLYFVPALNSSIPAYNSSSKEGWCLFYYDENGKTNGATTSSDFNVSTHSLGLDKSQNTLLFLTPYIDVSILHRPPLWAKTYQFGRSSNLTKQSWLFWITSGTYKDDKYAYISVESINAYKIVNPTSIISYDFISGDRIKFYVLYDTTGNPIQTYGDTHDYEIYEQVQNPDINGTVRNGQFVKIILPDTTSAFDFSSGLTLDYNNYYIELYTPAKAASEGLNVYYEFSEEYGIGNAGTLLAFHQGMLQNQTDDLITPATFKFNKGDAWYRTRTIPIGNTILYDLVQGVPFGSGTIIGQKLTTQAYSTPEYVLAANIAQQGFINNYNSPGWTINVTLNTYTFKVKGAINLRVTTGTPNFIRVQIYVVYGTNTILYPLGAASGPLAAGETVLMDVNTTIVMPPNSKSFLVMNSPSTSVRVELISGYLSYSEPQKDFLIGVVDQNFSDFYESKVNSDGRPFKVNPDEKTNYFSTLIRWGLNYQQNTNINQINRFYPDNFTEIDRAKGDIQRFKSRDRQLRVFQNRAVGQFGVYARFIQSNEGDSQLTTTNVILTDNNIVYYNGEFGLGDQYTSLVSSSRRDYFPDPVRGDDIRLADDGFTNLSELYKGQYTIRDLLVPYNKTYLRTNGATAKIIGTYDFREERWVKILQGGTNSGNTIDNYAFGFNEKNKGYDSFFSFNQAEWIDTVEDVIYSWKNGELWAHNNTVNRCNFYNIQYGTSITLVFNINLLEKKTWESITEIASAIWECPLIYGNVYSYSGQLQETMLGEYDFANLESNFHAAILRDQNSIGGILNGQIMKGNYLVVQLIKQNASDLIWLSEVSMMFKDSPLTNK